MTVSPALDPAVAVQPPDSAATYSPRIVAPVAHPSTPVYDQPPRHKGTGALITGITLIVSCGIPGTFTGVAAYERAAEGRSIFFQDGGSIATLAFGMSSLVVGIGLTTIGGIYRSRYNRWMDRHGLGLAMGKTTTGTRTAGLRLRF